MKKCNKCLQIKPLDEFHHNKNLKDGLYSSCKICTRSMNREYVMKNPQYNHDRKIRYINKDPERYRELHRQHNKNWVVNNIERSRLQKIKSEAKRRSIVGKSATTQEINELIVNSKNLCFWCGCNIFPGNLQLDHIYPLSKGGDNTIRNLVVSCAICNVRKNNKTPEKWVDQIIHVMGA